MSSNDWKELKLQKKSVVELEKKLRKTEQNKLCQQKYHDNFKLTPLIKLQGNNNWGKYCCTGSAKNITLLSPKPFVRLQSLVLLPMGSDCLT